MKTLGKLHVFGVAKLVMVVLFDSNSINIKHNYLTKKASGQNEPSLMVTII